MKITKAEALKTIIDALDMHDTTWVQTFDDFADDDYMPGVHEVFMLFGCTEEEINTALGINFQAYDSNDQPVDI